MQELREKNWQAMDAVGKAEKNSEEKLSSERKAKVSCTKFTNFIKSFL